MTYIITEQEQTFLLNWIAANQHRLQDNTCGPYRQNFNLLAEDPPLLREIKQRILEQEKISEWCSPPVLPDMVTIVTNEGYIHPHTDPCYDDSHHIRFNVCLSAPEEGGIPVYAGNEVAIEERQYSRYYVNSHFHSSTPVRGHKPRIYLSYGVSVKSEVNYQHFREGGYLIVRDFLSSEIIEFIQQYAALKIKGGQYICGDVQAPKGFTFDADPFFETILGSSCKFISEVAGVPLYPTYSYARLYGKGDHLTNHNDRDSCEISATLCLGNSHSDSPQPLYFTPHSDKTNPVKINLSKGDLCIYRGCSLYHWRDPFEIDWHLQLFLHYVNAQGPFANEKFDRRPYLGCPRK